MSDADGRTLRRTRNTEAVVDALLELLRAGNERPTVAHIADLAGVSERTVFRHFDDIDSLLSLAIDRQLGLLAPWLDAPTPRGPLESRVPAVVDHRAEILELITPVRRVVLRSAVERPALLAGPEEVDRRLREHVLGAFAAELKSRRGAAERRALGDALDVATCWVTWNRLRSDLGLEVESAKRVMTLTLRALLAAG